MTIEARHSASIQLSFNQLRKVSRGAGHLHNLSPAHVLLYAAVRELKLEMSLKEATDLLQEAWTELE